MQFDEALKLVGLAEGGYTNDPDDNGGETICGIARKKNPDALIWEMVDTWKARGNTDPKTLTKLAKNDTYFMNLVNAIYKGQYWDTCKCDLLPEIYRYPMFSCAVNCGHSKAISLLQEAMGIRADGIFGDQTRQSVVIAPKAHTLERFYELWADYYDRLVLKYPKNQKFLKGWKNRIEQVKKDNH